MTSKKTMQKQTVCIALIVLLFAFVAIFAVAGLHMSAQTAYAEPTIELVRCTTDNFPDNSNKPAANQFPGFMTLNDEQARSLASASAIDGPWFLITAIYEDHMMIYEFFGHDYVTSQTQSNTNSYFRSLNFNFSPHYYASAHFHDEVDFVKWEYNNSLPSVAGSYYLTQDVTVTGTWAVPTGVTNLCLNGHSIRKPDFTRITVNNGCTLNLYECDDTVKYVSYALNNNYDEITAVSAEAPANGTKWEDYIVVNGGFISTPKAQGVYVDAGGTFNMYGGTVCLCSRGVAVSSDTATFNMYGGTICACHNNPGVYTVGTTTIAGGVIEQNVNSMLGGGIYAERGTVTVSGGVIRNNRTNESYYDGGGIYVTSAGTLTISGGEISGNEAGHDGGGVCCKGEFHLSGGSITGNHAGGNGGGVSLGTSNYVSGNPVVQNNTAGEGNAVNNIYVNNYKLVVENPLTDGAHISVTMATPGVFTEGLDGNLPGGKTVDQVLYSDTIRYGVTLDGTEATLIAQHGHDETVFATAWESNNSLPDVAGSYYLTQDVTMAGDWNVDDCTINLCLNGYGIVVGNGYVNIKNGATLNLYDCGTSTRYITTNNGIFESVSNENSENAIGVVGGFIAGSTGYAVVTASSGGTFNMYGGNICCNGGGVMVDGTRTNSFTMYGGSICYNMQGVFVGQGTFTMEGGAISHNTMYGNSAGVWICDTFIMNGGAIEQNDASNNGGGVYINIYREGGYVVMNGGTITENAANTFGGGVYINNGTFTMNGGSISNNSAYAGGGVSNFGGTFTMTGGEISSNTGDELGGGVEVEGGTSFTMTGGIISGNTASMGAGISSGGVTILTGGSIINNTASYIGGGILISDGEFSEFHISGAPVINNNYDDNSEPVSNIYLSNDENDVLITIDGALTNETPYGVNMYTPGVFTNNNVAAYKDNFTPDNPDYVIKTTANNALTLALAHEHSFTYTVSGATITATCGNDDCDLPENKATLTLVAPTGNMVYDGNPRVATIQAGYNAEAFPDATIVYYKNNAVVDSCVNAGTYTATVTFDDATATVSFTITKATPDYEIPTGLNATYGDTLSSVGLPSGWTWVEVSTTAVGNAGDSAHNATFTPADTVNYDTATEALTITVSKANPAYTVPTGLSTVFNKTLASVTLPTGWAWNAPATNVGSVAGDFTFKATFTPADTANYNLVENIDVSVNVHEHVHTFDYTVDGAVITATCNNPDECPYDTFSATLTLSPYDNLVYDGTQKWIYTEYALGTEDIFEPFDVYYFKGDAIATPTNVGTYVAKATVHGVTAEITFTITPAGFADYNLTLSTDTLTYSGEEQSIAATVLHKDGGMPLQEGTHYTLSGQTATEVGEYTLTITGIGNYSGTKTATYHVVPANIEGIGIDAPEGGFDEDYIYVVSPWTTTYIHYWGDTNGGVYNTWPGVQMESLGNGLFRHQYPVLKNDDTAVFLIFNTNEGTEQTADLKDSKDVALGSVYFVTAKEPGQSHAATIFKSRDQQRAVVTLVTNSADVTSVVFAGKTLTVDVDYTVSYKTSGGDAITKPVVPGDYIAVVTGKGSYTGSVEKAFALRHEHSLTYAVSGATITATCSTDNCSLTDSKATLTISAPAGSLIYDGTAKVATLSAYDATIFAPEAIKYYKGETEVASCTDAGNYIAKVTSNGVTAQVSFTIAKTQPTYTVPTDLAATYGNTLADVELPEGWAWDEEDTIAVGNAGNQTHQATYTVDDNHETATETLTITVSKAIPDCTVPTGLTSLVDKTLDTVALPAGWTWNAPETNVGNEVGVKTFKATFTPADTDNYEIVENVDVTVNVSTHAHAFTYTANGATITATCGNAECYVTDGLTLTLVAPTGDMVYDGNARVATIQTGYNAEAFPNATIVYKKDNEVVDSCVNADTYTATVTFGDATAEVSFTIENWTFVEEDKGVTVEIEGAECHDDIIVEVEVRTDIASEQSQVDYSNIIKDNLAANEEIAIVYDVKLIQITVVDDVETKTTIQPDDIKPGTTVLIKMDIPEALRGKNFKLLHIHSADDVEYVEDYTISPDGTYLTVRVSRLSDFAFVITNESVNGNAKHGFCIGWIVFIFVMLLLLYTALYLIVWLPQTAKFAAKCKLDKVKEQREKIVLFGFVNLLLLIGLCASCAIWIFALVALCVHVCPVTIVCFVLATLILIFYGLILWCEWAKNKKNNTGKTITSDKEATPIDAKEEKKAQEVAATEEKATEKAEDGIGLKESLAMAATATRKEKITKASVEEYLKKEYASSVELNRRDNYTQTGLPLADTHYVKTEDAKTCFIYVYETEGATMLLLKTKDALGEELAKDHPSVRKSAFPKAKDRWYSVVIDDSLSNEQVEDMIDRTIALYTGAPVKKRTFAPIQTVKKVTVAEAIQMIEDEVAAAAIEVDKNAVSHVGKKDIINVDTISQNFNDGDTVTIDALKEKKLVPANSKQVKLLARGTLDKKLFIELQDYSIEAVKMVIATGGTVKRV